MPLHAHMQGLDTAQHQEAVHGPRYRTAAFLNKIQLLAQCGVVHHQCALDHVAMAAEVFGG
jgi:hypothetical protein